MPDETKLYIIYKNGVYAGIALNVILGSEGEQEILSFFDTNRGRTFYGKVTKEKKGRFTFKKTDGEMLELEIATRKSYDKHARPTIEGTIPIFNYEQDLHEWYRRRFL